MTRRFLLISTIFFQACTRSGGELKEALPESVEGGWSRRETRPLANEEIPEIVREAAPGRTLAATYGGNGTVVAKLFEFETETSAFALMQKWRQGEGVAFYRGKYFVVCASPDVDPKRISAFARSLQSAMRL